MLHQVADLIEAEIRVIVTEGGPEPGADCRQLGLFPGQQSPDLLRVIDLGLKPAERIDRKAKGPGTAISLE